MVRLAMVMLFGFCAAKCVAHSSIISPAPMNSTFCSAILLKMRCDSRTAAAAIDTLCADLGGAAHFLGDREAALEQLVQIGAQAARLVGGADGVLDLAEDLRLAQHHRVQPGGDAEGVAHRF